MSQIIKPKYTLPNAVFDAGNSILEGQTHSTFPRVESAFFFEATAFNANYFGDQIQERFGESNVSATNNS